MIADSGSHQGIAIREEDLKVILEVFERNKVSLEVME